MTSTSFHRSDLNRISNQSRKMKSTRAATLDNAPASEPDSLLGLTGFGLILLVVAVRPMLGETWMQNLDWGSGMIGPGPLTSITLDLIIVLATLIIAIDKLRQARRAGKSDLNARGPAWTPFALPIALMVVAAVCGTIMASNKRTAINGAINWLAMLLMFCALADMLKAHWKRRLLIGVVLAGCTVAAAKGYMQWGWEFNQTIEQFEQNKREFLETKGWRENDPMALAYISRLYSREINGFFPHSNVFSSLMIIGTVLGAALALEKWRRSKHAIGYAWAIIATILSLIIFSTFHLVVHGAPAPAWMKLLRLTGSKGGLIGVYFALLSLSFFGLLGHKLSRWRKNVLATAMVALVMAGAIVMAYGTARGELPSRSLTFRWHYWVGTMPVIGDHPWVGVGFGNFGQHYLKYKLPEAPEEVKDPHNVLLSTASQMGVVGAIGLLVFLGMIFVQGSRPPSISNAPEPPPRHNRVWRWSLPLAIGVFIIHASTTAGWGNLAVVIWLSAIPVTIWGLVLLGWLGFDDQLRFLDDHWSRWPVLGIACALGAFLLHSIVDLAMFYPGTATIFFALAATWMAGANTHARRGWAYPALAVAAAALLLAGVFFAYLPVLAATRQIEQAHVNAGKRDSKAFLNHLKGAMEADRLDPAAALTLGRVCAELGTESELAKNALKTAHQRDPADGRPLQWLAHVNLNDPEVAIGYMAKAVDRYPTNTLLQLRYADLLASAGRNQAALQHYEVALKCDAALDISEAKRLPSDAVGWILEKIDALRTKITNPDDSSMPRVK